MKIFNKTKNKHIDGNVKVLKSLREKSRGLRGALDFRGVYFETRWGIHTFGMREDIDVVILDSQNIARDVWKNMKPNQIFVWNPRWRKVLEVFPGSKIDKGDQLEMS